MNLPFFSKCPFSKLLDELVYNVTPCLQLSMINLCPSVYMVLQYHFTVLRVKGFGSLGSCISMVEIVMGVEINLTFIS